MQPEIGPYQRCEHCRAIRHVSIEHHCPPAESRSVLDADLDLTARILELRAQEGRRYAE